MSEYHVANLWRPFCSERCKMIDLGAWASDAYSIAGRAVEGNDGLDALRATEVDDRLSSNYTQH